jgi:hypothetical protein
MEIRMPRIADRPFADAVGERQNRRAGHIFQLDRLGRFDMARVMHRRSGNGAWSMGVLNPRPPRRARPGNTDGAILDRRRPPGQAETVRLTNNSIARYTPQM